MEAGEKLGFLPGDLQQKVDPYLRPLYDGLFDMLGAETYERLVEKQIIEVAPLAYMRGRTLDDSFIILDEAQNTTPEQMKMFLTRMGVGSKVVVTGDVTQIDLPGGTRSGLVDALKVLKDVNGIQPNRDDRELIKPSQARDPEISFVVALRFKPELASACVSPIVSVADTKKINATEMIAFK